MKLSLRPSWNIANFVPGKPILKDLKTYLANRNEPKQSINTIRQITEVSNSAEKKVSILKTERQMYGCHEL